MYSQPVSSSTAFLQPNRTVMVVYFLTSWTYAAMDKPNYDVRNFVRNLGPAVDGDIRGSRDTDVDCKS